MQQKIEIIKKRIINFRGTDIFTVTRTYNSGESFGELALTTNKPR